MNIKRFGEWGNGVPSSLLEDETGEYCLYSDYLLIERDYNQLKKDNSLLLDKLDEYRRLIKVLYNRIHTP